MSDPRSHGDLIRARKALLRGLGLATLAGLAIKAAGFHLWYLLLMWSLPLALVVAILLRQREPRAPRPPINLLAAIACVVGVSALSLQILPFMVAERPDQFWMSIPTPMIAVAGLFLATVALVQIWAAPDLSRSNGLVEAAILMGAVAILAWPLHQKNVGVVDAAVCREHVGALAHAMAQYATDHGHQVPASEHWCDSLGPYVDSREVFVCPERPELTCGYAFNEALDGLRDDVLKEPENVVAIFESDSGWNAHGGPELLPRRPRHYGGDNYGFSGGFGKWYHRGQGSSLQWRTIRNKSHTAP